MPSDHPRLAAFDLDGTLIDSASSITDGVLACWAACGFAEPDPRQIRRIIGLPWEESVRALLPGAGEAEFERIRAYHEEVRRGLRPPPVRSEAVVDGAHELLGALEEAGWLLAIVTNRASGRLRELLDEHGLSGRFAAVKTADMGPGKPSPYLLIEAMNDVGADRDSTVMIGDTTFDVLAAVNAGAASVGVSWGVHGPEELRAAGAHSVIGHFRELPPLLDRLAGR